MFERILVPLDGSMLAESVLVQVRRLLARENAELLLLRVVTMPPSAEMDAGETLGGLWSGASEYIGNLGRRLAAEGLRVRTRVVEGFPADQILEIAEKEKVSLIALSTHGRTGLSRWIYGSVTEKILRASTIPVLAIPSFVGAGGNAFPRGAKELPFRRILAPIAPSDASLEVLPSLTAFARLFGSTVLLVNVCDGAECAVAVPQMRTAYERLKEGGVPAEPLVKRGDPAVQILETSRESGADLIAMTTHGRSGIPRWLMGSVAEKVLWASNIPLLVVRPARKKSALRPKARKAIPAEFHSDP